MSTRTVVSTSRWVLWQLEVALRPEAVPRWAEALALVEHAVAGLALEGVPPLVAAEAQQRADDAYRSGSARLPSAIELSVSLQAEPSAPLALRAARAFVGPPAQLAADATAAAQLLASCKPVATLWTPTGPPGAATTAATGAAGVADAAWAAMRIPLQRVPLPPADAAMAALPPLRAPPPNPYFLQGAAADVPRPLMEAVVERRGGVRVLQLPGCAEGGFRSFVDGIACAAPPGEVLGGGRCRPMRTRLRPRMCGAIRQRDPKMPFLVTTFDERLSFSVLLERPLWRASLYSRALTTICVHEVPAPRSRPTTVRHYLADCFISLLNPCSDPHATGIIPANARAEVRAHRRPPPFTVTRVS